MPTISQPNGSTASISMPFQGPYQNQRETNIRPSIAIGRVQPEQESTIINSNFRFQNHAQNKYPKRVSLRSSSELALALKSCNTGKPKCSKYHREMPTMINFFNDKPLSFGSSSVPKSNSNSTSFPMQGQSRNIKRPKTALAGHGQGQNPSQGHCSSSKFVSNNSVSRTKLSRSRFSRPRQRQLLTNSNSPLPIQTLAGISNAYRSRSPRLRWKSPALPSEFRNCDLDTKPVNEKETRNKTSINSDFDKRPDFLFLSERDPKYSPSNNNSVRNRKPEKLFDSEKLPQAIVSQFTSGPTRGTFKTFKFQNQSKICKSTADSINEAAITLNQTKNLNTVQDQGHGPSIQKFQNHVHVEQQNQRLKKDEVLKNVLSSIFGSQDSFKSKPEPAPNSTFLQYQQGQGQRSQGEALPVSTDKPRGLSLAETDCNNNNNFPFFDTYSNGPSGKRNTLNINSQKETSDFENEDGNKSKRTSCSVFNLNFCEMEILAKSLTAGSGSDEVQARNQNQPKKEILPEKERKPELPDNIVASSNLHSGNQKSESIQNVESKTVVGEVCKETTDTGSRPKVDFSSQLAVTINKDSLLLLTKANARIRQLELLKRFSDLEVETLRADLSKAKHLISKQSVRLEELKPMEGPPWIVPSDENNNILNCYNSNVDYFSLRTFDQNPSILPGKIYNAQVLPSFKLKPRLRPPMSMQPKSRTSLSLRPNIRTLGKVNNDQVTSIRSFKQRSTLADTSPLQSSQKFRTQSAPPGRSYLNIYRRKIERERTFEIDTKSKIPRKLNLQSALQYLKAKSRASPSQPEPEHPSVQLQRVDLTTSGVKDGTNATNESKIRNRAPFLCGRFQQKPQSSLFGSCTHRNTTASMHSSTIQKSRIEYLAIAVASREGLIREIAHSIKKAKRILHFRFNALTSSNEVSISDLHFLLTSHRRFIRWMYNYVNYSMALMTRFDDKYMKSRNFFVPSTITAEGGSSLKGIFIPLPEPDPIPQSSALSDSSPRAQVKVKHAKANERKTFVSSATSYSKEIVPEKITISTNTTPTLPPRSPAVVKSVGVDTCNLPQLKISTNVDAGIQVSWKKHPCQDFTHNFSSVFVSAKKEPTLVDAHNNTEAEVIVSKILTNFDCGKSNNVSKFTYKNEKIPLHLQIFDFENKSSSLLDTDNDSDDGRIASASGGNTANTSCKNKYQLRPGSTQLQSISKSKISSTCSFDSMNSIIEINSKSNSNLAPLLSIVDTQCVAPSQSSLNSSPALSALTVIPSSRNVALARIMDQNVNDYDATSGNTASSVNPSVENILTMQNINTGICRSKPRIISHIFELEDGPHSAVAPFSNINEIAISEQQSNVSHSSSRRRSVCAANFMLNTDFNENSEAQNPNPNNHIPNDLHSTCTSDSKSEFFETNEIHQQLKESTSTEPFNNPAPAQFEHECKTIELKTPLDFELTNGFEPPCDSLSLPLHTPPLMDWFPESELIIPEYDLNKSAGALQHPHNNALPENNARDFILDVNNNFQLEPEERSDNKSAPYSDQCDLPAPALSPLDLLVTEDFEKAEKFYNHNGNLHIRTLDPTQYNIPFPNVPDNGCLTCRKKQENLILCKNIPRPRTPTFEEFAAFFEQTVQKYKEKRLTGSEESLLKYKSAAQVIMDILNEKEKPKTPELNNSKVQIESNSATSTKAEYDYNGHRICHTQSPNQRSIQEEVASKVHDFDKNLKTKSSVNSNSPLTSEAAPGLKINVPTFINPMLTSSTSDFEITTSPKAPSKSPEKTTKRPQTSALDDLAKPKIDDKSRLQTLHKNELSQSLQNTKSNINQVRKIPLPLRPASARSAFRQSRLPTPVQKPQSKLPQKPPLHESVAQQNLLDLKKVPKIPDATAETLIEVEPKTTETKLNEVCNEIQPRPSKSNFISSQFAKVGERMRKSFIPVKTVKPNKLTSTTSAMGSSKYANNTNPQEKVLRQIPLKRQIKPLAKLSTASVEDESSINNIEIGGTNLLRRDILKANSNLNKSGISKMQMWRTKMKAKSNLSSGETLGSYSSKNVSLINSTTGASGLGQRTSSLKQRR